MAAVMRMAARRPPRGMKTPTEKENPSLGMKKLPEKENHVLDVQSSIQRFMDKSNQGMVASDEIMRQLKALNLTTLDTSLLNELKVLVLQLVTLNCYSLKPILRTLLLKFIPIGDPNVPVEQMLKDNRNDFIHSVLEAIFKTIPLSVGVFLSLLPECMPFWSKSTYEQIYFVNGLLQATRYLPLQRRDILEVIVEHITKLDVNTPKREILLILEAANNEQFEMEIDEGEQAKKAETLFQKNTRSLDSLMLTVFEYIKDVCYTEDKLNWEETKLLYQDFAVIFDKFILPTHDSYHVQFIMFYICSFKQPLAEAFLDYLMKKLTNLNTASITRQASAAFIGSFIARSKYLPTSCVKKHLELLSQWVHSYIESESGFTRSQSEAHLHGPFYAVCQTLFYIFAFLHKQLVEMNKAEIFLRNLNFQRIVTCRLNPLRVCSPTVVKNFASITRNYQIAYCYTIIEKNNRATLPTSSSLANTGYIARNPLDSFYPFDPYVLPLSKEYVTAMINVYQKEAEEEEEEQDIEEDDFFYIPLISPDIGNPLPECIVYGMSPVGDMSPT